MFINYIFTWTNCGHVNNFVHIFCFLIISLFFKSAILLYFKHSYHDNFCISYHFHMQGDFLYNKHLQYLQYYCYFKQYLNFCFMYLQYYCYYAYYCFFYNLATNWQQCRQHILSTIKYVSTSVLHIIYISTISFCQITLSLLHYFIFIKFSNSL